MLSFLFFNPLVSSTLLMLGPSLKKKFINSINLKKFAFFSTIINFTIALILWSYFDGNSYNFQFMEQWILIKNYYLHVGVDGISLFFIILTCLTFPIVIFSSWYSIKNYSIYYLISFLILESILIAIFIVLDLVFFYITFESSLIPMFLIIGIWGSGKKKLMASYYFFLYTLFGSLFMLLSIIFMSSIIGTYDFKILSTTDFTFQVQEIVWLGFLLALAIKTPMVPFHLWLPEAHTEAPLGGSVVLAGIILKLATYGFLRVCLEFLPDASNFFVPFILNLAMISIMLSSFTTFRQIDLKRMIAYSSIGHMSIVNLGLFSNTIQGIEGSIMLSIMHGIVSPGLFICVGILYDRYHFRLIKLYGGLVSKMPIFTAFFFVLILGNMAVPLTGNFVGEFLCFLGVYEINPLFTVIAVFSMLLVSGYSIWAFNRISFGSESKFLLKGKDLTRREFFVLSILVFLTFYLGVYPSIILDYINFSVSFLLIDNLNIISNSIDNYSLSFLLFSSSSLWESLKFIKVKLITNLFKFKENIISPFLAVYVPLNLFNFYIYNLNLIEFFFIFVLLIVLLTISKNQFKEKYIKFMKFYSLILSFIIFSLIIIGYFKGIELKSFLISLGLIPLMKCKNNTINSPRKFL